MVNGEVSAAARWQLPEFGSSSVSPATRWCYADAPLAFLSHVSLASYNDSNSIDSLGQGQNQQNLAHHFQKQFSWTMVRIDAGPIIKICIVFSRDAQLPYNIFNNPVTRQYILCVSRTLFWTFLVQTLSMFTEVKLNPTLKFYYVGSLTIQ